MTWILIMMSDYEHQWHMSEHNGNDNDDNDNANDDENDVDVAYVIDDDDNDENNVNAHADYAFDNNFGYLLILMAPKCL